MSLVVKAAVDNGFAVINHLLDTVALAVAGAEDSVVDAAHMAVKVADATFDMGEAEVVAFAKAVLERVHEVADKAVEPLP